MITKKEIKELNEISTKTPTVSLYLNTDQKYYTPEQILINQKNLLRKVKDLVGEENYNFILDKVGLGLEKDIKGVALFVNPRENISYIYKFSKPFPNQIHTENNLHLKPLLSLLDEYERYCVLLVDKEKAKVFSVYLGEIEDMTNIFNEFPGKHAQGGWSQQGNQAHVDAHHHENLKEAADKAFSFFKEKKFNRLIISGSKEILPELKEMLHPYLQERLAGEFLIELFKSNQEILNKSLEIEESIERKKENEQVEKLINNLGYKNKAINGLDEVLQASFEKKIMKLIVQEGLQEPGYICTNCNKLIYQQDDCAECENNKEKVEDIVDELVQQVIAQGGEVEFVRDNKDLTKIGSIGAFLRY